MKMEKSKMNNRKPFGYWKNFENVKNENEK